MSSGIPYDSEAGRALCASLSAIMTGVAYATSAEMAAELGPFPRFAENREPMLRVMRNHRRAAHGDRTGYEAMTNPPVPLDHKANPDQKLAEHAKRAWDRALELGESTATAMRRQPWWRRPAPSASSWIATPPASSPISRW